MSVHIPYQGKMHSDRLGRDFTVTIIHCGLVIQKQDKGDRYIQDKWIFSIIFDALAYSFDYWTGIGHRKLQKRIDCERWRVDRAKKIMNGAAMKQTDENFAMVVETLDAGSVAVLPKIDDVLYALIMDAEALDYTFEDWCSNCGYDTDSRKAFATYEACKANGEKLKRIVGDVGAAREKFQDY